VRFDDQAQIHPRRLALRLAEGLDVYEQTRVLDLAEHSDGVELTTEHGTVRAAHVVLATLLPFDDAGAFFAKTEPVRSYAMAVRINGAPPSAMYLGVDSPTRSVRPLTFDDGDVGLVIGGNGHRVGEEDDTPGQYDDLEAWARATFPVRAVEARWSAQDYVPVDHVPYIGRSPRRRHTFVATGFQKWGMTTAFVAGSILADAITGRENPWREVFDASRADVAESAKDFVTTNAHILKPFVQGHLRRTRRCTHLGCLVTWNEAERSWDCP
jgi:glycine/D-amino acid oxidase-like deaminating enzyme